MYADVARQSTSPISNTLPTTRGTLRPSSHESAANLDLSTGVRSEASAQSNAAFPTPRPPAMPLQSAMYEYARGDMAGTEETASRQRQKATIPAEAARRQAEPLIASTPARRRCAEGRTPFHPAQSSELAENARRNVARTYMRRPCGKTRRPCSTASRPWSTRLCQT